MPIGNSTFNLQKRTINICKKKRIDLSANMKSVKRMIVSHESIGLVNVKVSAGTNTKFDAFLIYSTCDTPPETANFIASAELIFSSFLTFSLGTK